MVSRPSHTGNPACYELSTDHHLPGPNATTFIVPGECFPTRYRSTSHGLSAASGKLGAIVAQVVIGPLRGRGAPKGSSDSPWLNHVMQIFAFFMFCGIFTTMLIPETKRKTLEELAGEVPGTANYDAHVATGAAARNAHKLSHEGSSSEEYPAGTAAHPTTTDRKELS